MTFTMSVDTVFMLILLVTLILEVLSLELPLLGLFSVGISTLILIPNTETQYASNAMIGNFTVLITFFSFACIIIGAVRNR